MHSKYKVVYHNEALGQLLIRDIGHSIGKLTVTNDIERVVTEVLTKYPETVILVYEDSEGNFTQVLFNRHTKKFLEFGTTKHMRTNRETNSTSDLD